MNDHERRLLRWQRNIAELPIEEIENLDTLGVAIANANDAASRLEARFQQIENEQRRPATHFGVFAYGTLRPGEERAETLAMADSVYPALLSGFAMFDVGAWPFIRASFNGEGSVVGDLYVIDKVWQPIVLGHLDLIEGVGHRLFERVQVPWGSLNVARGPGKTAVQDVVWTYVAGPLLDNIKSVRVTSGDWKNR